MCSQKLVGNAGGYSRSGRLNFEFPTNPTFTDLELFRPIAASDLICVGLTSGFAEKLSNETKKCMGLFLVQGVSLGTVESLTLNPLGRANTSRDGGLASCSCYTK